MQHTNIEWTATKNPDGTISKGYVWNPVTGCSKVSAGCKNCYAEAIANRFWGERKFTDVQIHPNKLSEPFKKKKRGIVFVNSMSDLFHPAVPDEFIIRLWLSMACAPWHTFIILTKRPQRMFQFFKEAKQTLPNVWLGVSVENQDAINGRIPFLLKTPAAKRIVSVEPMLSFVDFFSFDLKMLDWIICGGESGPGARPHPALVDVRHLKDQCVRAGVPFFLKQMWGEKTPQLDGQIWDQKPERKL